MAEKVDTGSAASSEMVDLNAVSESQLIDSSGSRGMSEDQLSVVTELSAFAIPQPDTISLSMSMITDDAYSILQSTHVSPKESFVEEEGEETEKKDFSTEAELMDELEVEGDELTEEKSGSEEKIEESAKEEQSELEEYTHIDVVELNAMGEEVTVKKLVPKIKEETFVKKKMVPITVKFNRIGDGDELIEEEETVEEEMSFMVTRMTVLVKQLNDKGEEVLVEKVIEKEVLIEEKPKKKKIIIRKTLPSGEEIEEEIEIEEQEKSVSRKSELSTKYEEEFFDEQEGNWEYEDYTQEFIDEGGEARHIKSKRRIWKPKYKEPPINAIIEDEKQLKSELLEELKKVRSKLRLYRQKNKFLGKKLCQFYKIKRKDIKEEMQRLSPETEAILRRQYHRRLLEYNEVRQFLLTEMETRSHILKEAKNTSEQLKAELDSRIDTFFEQQREILKKLDPKVVKIVLRNVDFEKVLDQQLKMDRMLSDVRRDYVRKMYQFTELKEKHAMRKRAKPSDRENDIDIVTYEQLKVATRDLQDTLDMKESYIQKLKETLVHAVQTLAHVRFKREAIDQSLENINKEMVDAKRELADLRNECRTIREKRFKVMEEVKKFNDKSGLLKYPMLVKDYYEITDDKMFLDEELIKVKMTVDNQKMLLEDVKKKRRAQNKLKK